MSKQKVLYFDDEQPILDMMDRLLSTKDIECNTVNAKVFDPLQHELLAHDCGIDNAPCKIYRAVFSDFDFHRDDGTNGLTLLKLYRESQCQMAETMPLALVSAGLPASTDMTQFDQDLDDFDILFEEKPFNLERLILALKVII